MTSLPIYNRQGQEIGKYDIDPGGIAPRISKQLLHDVVVMYQANRRQGTSKTKTRGEVAGSTKKMYRQKGTGNARAGGRRSGVRRGGGHIHSILPRDYSYRHPRKAVRLATRMAIASRIMDQEMIVIDELSFAKPATQEMAAILTALKMQSGSMLITTAEQDLNVYRSARNIKGVSVTPMRELNALEVLRPQHWLITKDALDALRAKCAEEQKETVA
ncbi:MAG TPA: 50S ribosomal protein L4 [Pirellulaceae bacterium]